MLDFVSSFGISRFGAMSSTQFQKTLVLSLIYFRALSFVLNQSSSLCCTLSFNSSSHPSSFASIIILGQVSPAFGKKIIPFDSASFSRRSSYSRFQTSSYSKLFSFAYSIASLAPLIQDGELRMIHLSFLFFVPRDSIKSSVAAENTELKTIFLSFLRKENLL